MVRERERRKPTKHVLASHTKHEFWFAEILANFSHMKSSENILEDGDRWEERIRGNDGIILQPLSVTSNAGRGFSFNGAGFVSLFFCVGLPWWENVPLSLKIVHHHHLILLSQLLMSPSSPLWYLWGSLCCVLGSSLVCISWHLDLLLLVETVESF